MIGDFDLLDPTLSSQIEESLLEDRKTADQQRALIGIERDKSLCHSTNPHGFFNFVKLAWSILHQSELEAFVDALQVRAVCLHLQAISLGKLNPHDPTKAPRLAINMPGGFAKSILVSVLWPAWEWTFTPHMKYLTTAYQQEWAKRDSRRMRVVVQSAWYQARWPLRLVREGEMSFENEFGGHREAVPFDRLTAGRGNRVIIDDPHSIEQVESETDRKRVIRVFRESVPDRLNNQRTDAIIVMMHRLHQDDLCGAIKEICPDDYVWLVLPMEFDPDRCCHTPVIDPDTGKPWRDPRVLQGEGALLDPQRVPRKEVERLKREMGNIAVAGKLQQDPVPREGAMFKRDWFDNTIISELPADNVRWVRRYDLAATQKGGAATVGLLMGRTSKGLYIIADCRACREEGARVREFVKEIAKRDGKAVHISLPQDPGQAGKAQAQDYVSMLTGYKVSATPETGSKNTRAEPFSAQCEAHNVRFYVPPGADRKWVEDVIHELCNFPFGKYKDRVDACSGAFAYLTTQKISNYTLDNL